MLLRHHNEDTSLEQCLLIVTENALRCLYYLNEGMNTTPTRLWNALDYRNDGVADMVTLGLIEDQVDETNEPHFLGNYTIKPKGIELLAYAQSVGVVVDSETKQNSMDKDDSGLSLLMELVLEHKKDLLKLCLTLIAIVCMAVAFVSEYPTEIRIVTGVFGMLLLGLRMSTEPDL